MYCSSCGSAITQNLTYCNRCGARVSATNADSIITPAEIAPDLLVCAIVGLFILGIGVIIGLMAVMKEVVHFNEGITLFLTMLTFSLLLGLEGMLIWLLLKGRRRTGLVAGPEQLEEHTTQELADAQARRLSEPVMSVTEHTTRAFDPIYIERK